MTCNTRNAAELSEMFSPALVAALEQLVDERVAAALAALDAADNGARWLTLAQAAELLGSTPDAVRMRCKRGRLEHRRQGRRVYVSRESVDRL
jgi:excisionase family DNA binding protein